MSIHQSNKQLSYKLALNGLNLGTTIDRVDVMRQTIPEHVDVSSAELHIVLY